MKLVALSSILFASLGLAAPAYAEDAAPAASAATPAAVKRNQLLLDSEGKRLGRIEELRNGQASFIREDRFVKVPLSTITSDGKVARTTLSWAELRR